MAVGFAQTLTKISTTNISCCGKGIRCIGVTIFTPSHAYYLEIWEPQTPGTLWAWVGVYRECFNFILSISN